MFRTGLIMGVAAAIVLAAPAGAAQFTYSAVLSGASEVPPNTSTATGFISVVVDNVARSIAVNETWSGLTGGPATGAHIHCCALPTGTAPIVVPFDSFPSVVSGTYTNTFTPVAFDSIFAGIAGGLAYANIHNGRFPGGEIRGQLAAVPEPAGWATMLLGFAAVGGAMRRRWQPRLLHRAG